jgi:hypothetical protein
MASLALEYSRPGGYGGYGGCGYGGYGQPARKFGERVANSEQNSMDLGSAIGDIRSMLRGLCETVSSVDKRLDDVVTGLAQTKEKVSALQDKTASLETCLTATEEGLAALTSRQDAKMSAFEVSISSLQLQLNQLQDTVKLQKDCSGTPIGDDDDLHNSHAPAQQQPALIDTKLSAVQPAIFEKMKSRILTKNVAAALRNYEGELSDEKFTGHLQDLLVPRLRPDELRGILVEALSRNYEDVALIDDDGKCVVRAVEYVYPRDPTNDSFRVIFSSSGVAARLEPRLRDLMMAMWREANDSLPSACEKRLSLFVDDDLVPEERAVVAALLPTRARLKEMGTLAVFRRHQLLIKVNGRYEVYTGPYWQSKTDKEPLKGFPAVRWPNFSST